MARRSPRLPYSIAKLRDVAPAPPLTGRQLDEVAFPLGGLGTGCVSLGGWGQLRDWEIRNRPAKGATMPQAFFQLKCRTADGATVTKVLEGPVGGRYAGDGHSLERHAGQGLARFREVSFEGRFPIATVRLSDPAVPLRVELEAFNPFLPLNAADSGLPIAILVYRLTNRTRQPVTATIFGNLTNIVGDAAVVDRVNVFREGDGLAGLEARTAEKGTGAAVSADSPHHGSLVLATPVPGATGLPRWPNQPWFGWLDHFWRGTALSDRLPEPSEGGSDTGTLAVTVEVAAGATVEVPMLLAWHFPRCWHWTKQESEGKDTTPSWLNWYATQWDDAWDVAAYAQANFDRLRTETRRFRDTLFESTLPAPVLDAVSSQISILKSPTCLRLTDGTFYGFEGCSNQVGCCEGSCTHVWNYAQALPYLFPDLQRSMREADWAYALLEDGYDVFRMPLPLGAQGQPSFHAAADGQMGTVIQTWREYLICGDDAWLKAIWPKAKRALEFAWKYWDADRDGVMEGMQHNTYDIEYYGPNTMMGSLYLAALRAGERMAKVVGDDEAAATYARLAEQGGRWTDEHLFNGEYYEQQVRPEAWQAWPEPWQERSIGRYGYDSVFTDWPKWQVGKGCLSDQLIGQWYAEMLGLGKLYDPEHVRATLAAIFGHNWKAELIDHPNPMRIYAVNDEAGLLICSWPRGERPGDPSVYADEVWCGIEYQVASHLIYEGFVAEGLAIVKGLRARYDGERRNPWDEIECGHHYVRSMASYSLLLALSGFRYDAAAKELALRPKLPGDEFAVFFSVGSGWGLVRQRQEGKQRTITVEVRGGTLGLANLALDGRATKAEATCGRKTAACRVTRGEDGVRIELDEALEAAPGRKLTIRLA